MLEWASLSDPCSRGAFKRDLESFALEVRLSTRNGRSLVHNNWSAQAGGRWSRENARTGMYGTRSCLLVGYFFDFLGLLSPPVSPLGAKVLELCWMSAPAGTNCGLLQPKWEEHVGRRRRVLPAATWVV